MTLRDLDSVLRAIAARVEDQSFAQLREAHRGWRGLLEGVVGGDARGADVPPEWNLLPRRHPRLRHGRDAIDAFVVAGASSDVLVWAEGARRCWRASLRSDLDALVIADAAVDAYVLSADHAWAFVLTLDQIAFQPIGPFFVSADAASG